ncbi:MAG: histidine triad nucleotide-binding protein [Eubacteriaceae bacterium]|nr:histidine triad nucleotide-binding protein [Eubacteriaceae bacterium]
MEDCLFCKIASREIPTDIVYEDDDVIAFNDIDPQAPIHIVIIPREHFDNVLNVPAGSEIIGKIFVVINKLAVRYGISQDGFRIVNNMGEDGGQSVNHLHFHLMAGRKFSWPAG